MGRAAKIGLYIFMSVLFIGALNGSSYGVPFSVYQDVYLPNGSSGEADTANSYGTARLFRPTIAAQIATSEYAGAGKNYYASDGTATAYYYVNTDGKWTEVPAIGQVVAGVVEVVSGVRECLYKVDRVGFSKKSIISKNISDGYIQLPNVWIQPIPTPEARLIAQDSVVVCWPSIRTFDDSGDRINMVETYAVYRSEHPSGPFEWKADVPHKDGEMMYKDRGVSIEKIYYYKLKLRYSWPANRPPYYETAASSAASPGITVK